MFFCGEEEGKLLFVRLEFPGEQRKTRTKLNLENQVKLSGVRVKVRAQGSTDVGGSRMKLNEEEGKLLFVRLEFPGEQRKRRNKLDLGYQVKLNGVFNEAVEVQERS